MVDSGRADGSNLPRFQAQAPPSHAGEKRGARTTPKRNKNPRVGNCNAHPPKPTVHHAAGTPLPFRSDRGDPISLSTESTSLALRTVTLGPPNTTRVLLKLGPGSATRLDPATPNRAQPDRTASRAVLSSDHKAPMPLSATKPEPGAKETTMAGVK